MWNTICKEQNCKKIANYNIDGEDPLYCKKHSKTDMIDVKSKKCKEPECYKQPSFNIDGKKPLYCKKHKKSEMINVKNNKCVWDDCLKQGINVKFKKRYCKKHTNILVFEKTKCETAWCKGYRKKEYSGFCLRCFKNKFV